MLFLADIVTIEPFLRLSNPNLPWSVSLSLLVSNAGQLSWTVQAIVSFVVNNVGKLVLFSPEFWPLKCWITLSFRFSVWSELTWSILTIFQSNNHEKCIYFVLSCKMNDLTFLKSVNHLIIILCHLFPKDICRTSFNYIYLVNIGNFHVLMLWFRRNIVDCLSSSEN